MLLKRRLTPVLLAATAALLAAPLAWADVVWSKDTGWSIEGGALSGLSGEDSRTALNLMNVARRYEERGWFHTAARYYERVADRFPNSVFSAEALYRAGQCYLAKKEFYHAFSAYQKTVAYYPNSNRFSEIVSQEYRIASAILDGARNRYFWGSIPGLKNPERALEFYETVIASAPSGDYAPLSLMNVAEAHLRFKQREEAIDSYNRMINSYPTSLLTADAYLKLGKTYASLADGPEYDQSSTKEAITFLTDFMIRFPNDGGIPEAEKTLAEMRSMMAQSKIKIGDFYFYKRSNYKAARVFYNEAITAYANSEDAKLARARLDEVDAKESGKRIPPRTDGTPAAPKRKRFIFF